MLCKDNNGIFGANNCTWIVILIAIIVIWGFCGNECC